MKLLLVIAVILQVSLSNQGNINVIQPVDARLYPIFELIGTKMHKYLEQAIPTIETVINNMVAEEESTELDEDEDYENDVDIKNFLNTLLQFIKEPNNCYLQRATEYALFEAAGMESEYDDLNELFEDVILSKDSEIEADDTPISEIIEELPNRIKNFIESLNDEEKLQYAELYQSAMEILYASEEKTRFEAILNFLTEPQLQLVEPNDENCIWDLFNLTEFMQILWDQI